MAHSKKDFTTTAADVLLDKITAPAEPTPAKQIATASPSTIKKPRTNKAGEEKGIYFMVDKEVEHKLRYIAFAEDTKQKTIINDALRAYITDYEKKHGAIE